jgi:hypothetical protein
VATPLFIAGGEAIGQDRVAIRALLSELFEDPRIRDVELALEFCKTIGWTIRFLVIGRVFCVTFDLVVEEADDLIGTKEWDCIPF